MSALGPTLFWSSLNFNYCVSVTSKTIVWLFLGHMIFILCQYFIACKGKYVRKLVMAPEGRHIMAASSRRQFSKRKGYDGQLWNIVFALD